MFSVEVFKNLKWEEAGIKISEEYKTNLRFADDMVLMNELADTLQKMILQLHRGNQKLCFRMNRKKPKVMFNNYIPGH